MECFGESLCTRWADALHLLPFVRISLDDRSERSEAAQEGLGADAGDAGDRGQGCFGRRSTSRALWALGVGGSIPVMELSPPYSKPYEPKRRILGVDRAQKAHAEVHQCDADTPDRDRVKRPIVEIRPFNQHVRKPRHVAHASDLRPEPPRDDRRMQAACRLPLHDRALSDEVISSPKIPAFDRDAELAEKPWHTAGSFMCVDDDSKHGLHTLAVDL